MADLVAVLLILAATAAVLVFANFCRNKNEMKKIPPGYPTVLLPFIGETLHLVKPQRVDSLGHFMETRMSRFGKIFSSHLLGSPTVVSADPELNRFVLKNDDRLFVQGWPSTLSRLLGPGSASVAAGDAHRRLRSTIMELLSREKLRKVFVLEADRIASQIIGSWDEGTPILAQDEATKFSFCIVVKSILSFTIGMQEMETQQREYNSFSRGLVSLPLDLPGTNFRKALQSRKNIIDIIRREVEKRRADSSWTKEDCDNDDFLCWLMKNTEYSTEETGDLLLSLIFGGHDTTSKAISALIYFLHGCPSAVKQLREGHLEAKSLRKLKGDDEEKLTWDDYKGLEFTRCVINETLRLSSISNGIPKRAVEDIEFRDYIIPKGWNVMLHNKSVHLDPCLYDKPEQFNPWRWLSPSSSMKMAHNFMPFGGGARSCPGSELTRLEMAVFVHHLVSRFEGWELLDPADIPVHTPSLRFPGGLAIKVRPARS